MIKMNIDRLKLFNFKIYCTTVLEYLKDDLCRFKSFLNKICGKSLEFYFSWILYGILTQKIVFLSQNNTDTLIFSCTFASE